jgi:uncharacterized protein YndB with AHSA1/START domain
MEMTKIESTIIIQRPVAEVFAYLVASQNYPKWSVNFEEAKQTSSGSVGVGTTVWFRRRFCGRRIEGTMEVTQYEPDRRLVVRSTLDPLPFQTWYTLEPTESVGTRLDCVSELKPTGIYALLDPLIASMGQRQLEASLQQLKKQLEAPVMAAAAP